MSAEVKEGRKEEKEGRKEGRKEGKEEGPAPPAGLEPRLRGRGPRAKPARLGSRWVPTEALLVSEVTDRGKERASAVNRQT